MTRKTVAIVQARMGSVRFPGKMTAMLGHYPILEWVLSRVSLARKIDEVILATTDIPRDDILVGIAKRCGVHTFRGSETDVLGRFVSAGLITKADSIVRICADNPLVDPDEIDRLIDYFYEHPCDYSCNHQDRLGSRYADGFGAEIIAFDTLQAIALLTNEIKHREHVTLYIWDHPQNYRISVVPAPPELAYPKLRFDVDTPDDLARLNKLCAAGVTLETGARKVVSLANIILNRE